ncbi:NADP-dependent 3-hydroxy acid dehydrogenase YdfG [Halopolyspora algeriensis]|uniref:NADP-dependent 3-hydroxy acid dehydrogenase YdfG n=1 Tax=Halopolyspora algeriensis TaxID=1500506 RepID=A0A368VWS0_9ACTN|nr:SDR family oxidoreductase [Halopolyspora algeriensis]RCW46299.1 NADP-dependent 3-hydroxy acid dehydrogenase YdfG [Halopolyspora algeriensis]TQM55699.1 NADP-dependent 3-hydroxy acid dehydrogenase YdfG [Halopolyspora algeriensis]
MARHSRSLSGKVVAVTGGGRGIGAATAAALARRGAKVAVGDLDLAQAEKVAAELGSDAAIALQLDVTDHADFTTFLDRVESDLGPIDVLVNNAGIMPIALIEDESDHTTASQLAVNLHAVIHGSREAVRRMKPRRSGHIVNLASGAGKIPVGGGATYCATKFGVAGFTEALRMEVREAGIDVSGIFPAIVRTELAAGLRGTRGVRAVTPDDVAEAIVEVLQRPRPEVYVPKALGVSVRYGGLMPRRMGEWVNRKMGGERMFLDALNSAERKNYEARAAASAPAAEREDAR